MSESRQSRILKLIFVQTVLVFPIIAWVSALNYALQQLLPKNRKRKFSSLLMFALVLTLLAIIILSLVPFRLPGITVDVSGPEEDTAFIAEQEEAAGEVVFDTNPILF